ncbi:iron-containing alcohol dehydrogenase [Martelella alba]|uniref:argininosuccinate synthase n=1 Tax=Martelella alba TaxID=2590451 RepID=A0ABY2SHL3_9HYPH|nr:iron-containing alcohol dehydrogenase [Martelella alba]TKI04112.1 iron-containing alcohol dehydrogenase [Martelella alba]
MAKTPKIITDVIQIQGRALLLYSGGLDTTYIAFKLLEQNIDLLLLNVNLQADKNDLALLPQQRDKKKLIHIDASDEFIKDYLTPAIINGFMIDDEYPVSASLAFPLIAKKSVEYAQREEVTTIIHGAEREQNAMSRLNKMIKKSNTDLSIFPYALYDSSSRAEKIAYLRSLGHEVTHYDVSRDKNLWCECIEGGEYEIDKFKLKFNDFFSTRGREINEEDIHILQFQAGVPTAFDGTRLSLKDILLKTKDLASNCHIGYYSSYEFNGLEKKREVHYSPSSAIFHRTKRALERISLSEPELETKYLLDRKWLCEVIRGEWSSFMTEAITVFNKKLWGKVTNKGIPVIAVPTLPGTATEFSATAVLTGEGYKLGINSPHVRPVEALVELLLFTTLRPEVGIPTLLDSYIHSFECLEGKKRQSGIPCLM